MANINLYKGRRRQPFPHPDPSPHLSTPRLNKLTHDLNSQSTSPFTMSKCSRKVTPYECGHEDVDYKFCGGSHPDTYGHRKACYNSYTPGSPLPTSERTGQMPGGCTRDCTAKLYGWTCCECKELVKDGVLIHKHEENEHDFCDTCELGWV